VEETRTIVLAREAYPSPPWLDTAVSHALLEAVAAGEEPETLRLYRPAPVLAFGPADRLSAGYGAAREAARAAGFAPVERMAGGHAAVFHEETIAFAWTVPDAQARATIRPRFEAVAALVREALAALGVEANIGCVAGEYCPGDYSVNAGGRRKLMGVGQRVFPKAAHVGGVIVVDGADRIRDVLLPVNAALGIEWDPPTAGAVRDEVPGATWDAVAEAVIEAFAARFDVRVGAISPAVLERARSLASRFADEPVETA
jgi:octanoyl-[GcvH]:protein N-octanoyltransferase